MAVRTILEVQAKPGTEDELVAFFRPALPAMRACEGCTNVDALKNSDDADNVEVVEVWDSREQNEECQAWQQEKGTIDRLMEFLAESPGIRHFDIIVA